MSESTSNGTSSKSGIAIPILCGAVLAVVVGSLYLFYQLNLVRGDLDQVRDQLAQTRSQLTAEIARVHENSTVSTQTSQSSVDALKAELDAARMQARKLVGDAQVNATQHANEIAARLEKVQKIQQEQTQNVMAVSDKVSQVKSDADATKTQVSEVSNDLGNVKTELTTTKSELEKTIGDMTRTMGELGVQSGLIATNTKELMALKALGDRNYTDFVLHRDRILHKVGDVHIQLKVADPKRNRYSIDVMIDDKVTEKKDKAANEPIQLMRTGFTQPYEVIVNEIKKDTISGYVSAPKVSQVRN